MSALGMFVACGFIFTVGWAMAKLGSNGQRLEDVERLVELTDRWRGRAARSSGAEAQAYLKARAELLREARRIEQGDPPEPRRPAT